MGFTKGHTGQTVAFKDGLDQDLDDADGLTPDQVVGVNTVRLVVTPEDPAAATGTYTLTIYRAAPSGVTAVPADWPLKPAALSGDQFRLMLLTSTGTVATSTSIGDYDAVVRAAVAADSGHAAVRDVSGLLKVLTSTAAVSARDHTGTDLTDGGAEGVPIYWLNGAKIADHYEDFWEASSWTAPPTDESGTAYTSVKSFWTGSAQDGTKETGRTLGSNPAIRGRNYTGSNARVDFNTGDARNTFRRAEPQQALPERSRSPSGVPRQVSSALLSPRSDQGDQRQIFSLTLATDHRNTRDFLGEP